MRSFDQGSTSGVHVGPHDSKSGNCGEPFPDIGDYAAIGDGRYCVLIDKSGAIEWMCWPDFSSPTLFAALLDRQAGHFRIAPEIPYRTERSYAGSSTVLRTRFHTDEGILQVTDCAVVPASRDSGGLEPQRELLREVTCLRGTVPVRVEFVPRPGYGRVRPRLQHRKRLGWHFRHARSSLYLRGDFELHQDIGNAGLFGREVLAEGQTRTMSLTLDTTEPGTFPLLGADGQQRVQRTLQWWENWGRQCRYSGPYREAVQRSVLTLKLLTSCLSGAMVAAPTTSLPEWVGGDRNWDYRYCWVRDGALALHAFLRLGYLQEASRFLRWLLHGTRLHFPLLQVMYGTYGETRMPERKLPWLSGYCGSRPVRVGNDASKQFQLDIYGELVASVSEFVQAGGQLDVSERNVLRRFGQVVVRHWRDPDNGIWESRSGRKHHTYSKAMCWFALQQLARLLPDAPERQRWEQECELVRLDIESSGFDTALGSYVAVYGTKKADGSLLLLTRIGFHKPDHPRLQGTFAFIDRTLRHGEAALYRTAKAPEMGSQTSENLFSACSFWAVEHLALAGQVAAARQRFEALLTYANDVGLYSEELERDSHRQCGNFPQALTHMSLISAALALDSEQGSQRGRQ